MQSSHSPSTGPHSISSWLSGRSPELSEARIHEEQQRHRAHQERQRAMLARGSGRTDGSFGFEPGRGEEKDDGKTGSGEEKGEAEAEIDFGRIDPDGKMARKWNARLRQGDGNACGRGVACPLGRRRWGACPLGPWRCRPPY